MENAIYHACRLSHLAGTADVPWHFTLHAIREGLGMKTSMTHKLTEEELTRYPVLREIMNCLREVRPE